MATFLATAGGSAFGLAAYLYIKPRWGNRGIIAFIIIAFSLAILFAII